MKVLFQTFCHFSIDSDLRYEVVYVIAYGSFFLEFEGEAVVLPLLGDNLWDAVEKRRRYMTNSVVCAIMERMVNIFYLLMQITINTNNFLFLQKVLYPSNGPYFWCRSS